MTFIDDYNGHNKHMFLMYMSLAPQPSEFSLKFCKM